MYELSTELLRRLTFWLLCFVFVSSAAEAQWKNVAPQLLGRVPYWGGSIHFKQGVLWAGELGLWKSLDTGSTWTNVLPANHFARPIVDIAFFNDAIGLIAVRGTGIYRTTDGGASWNQISNVWASNVRFGDSPLEIYVTESYGSSGAIVYKTNDGGINWSAQPINEFMPGLAVRSGGHAFLFAGDGNSRLGSVYASIDRGATWNRRGGNADWDSYTLTVDTCDENLMYLANENQITTPFDNLSVIYVSRDGGASWSMAVSHPGFFFSGSIETSGNAVYTQTFANGVYRSTDFGVTFLPSGGPSGSGDTRTLCVVSDNIILAADTLGNIWRTTNSGGDSLRVNVRANHASIAQALPPTTDTVSACDTTTRYVFLLLNSVCQASTILEQSIVGVDANNFAFAKQAPGFFATGDSIILTLHPDAARIFTAALRVKFSDGTSDTILLHAVATQPRATLSLSDSILFQYDSVSVCQPRVTREIILTDRGCYPRSIIAATLTGDSALHYRLTTNRDSFYLGFSGGEGADYPAELRIVLSDSTRLVVSLIGHGKKATHKNAISPSALFTNDTLSICGDPVVRSIVLRDSSCPARKIVAQFLSGPDSARYAITHPFDTLQLANDTAQVQLVPNESRSHNGIYVVEFDDGTRDTISLFGFVRSTPNFALRTQGVFVDTLGGSAYVPIKITGARAGDAITAVLHFDTTMLIYEGSFDVSGARLDRPLTAGTSLIQLVLSDPNSTITSIFEVFPIDSACTSASFDSIEYLSAGRLCQLAIPTPLTSTICTNLGCGVKTLSKFTRYKTLPQISISPNPASSTISIFSSQPLQDAGISIVDAKGIVQLEERMAGNHATVDLSTLSDGVYFVRIEDEQVMVLKRIVKESR